MRIESCLFSLPLGVYRNPHHNPNNRHPSDQNWVTGSVNLRGPGRSHLTKRLAVDDRFLSTLLARQRELQGIISDLERKLDPDHGNLWEAPGPGGEGSGKDGRGGASPLKFGRSGVQKRIEASKYVSYNPEDEADYVTFRNTFAPNMMFYVRKWKIPHDHGYRLEEGGDPEKISIFHARELAKRVQKHEVGEITERVEEMRENPNYYVGAEGLADELSEHILGQGRGSKASWDYQGMWVDRASRENLEVASILENFWTGSVNEAWMLRKQVNCLRDQIREESRCEELLRREHELLACHHTHSKPGHWLLKNEGSGSRISRLPQSGLLHDPEFARIFSVVHRRSFGGKNATGTGRHAVSTAASELWTVQCQRRDAEERVQSVQEQYRKISHHVDSKRYELQTELDMYRDRYFSKLREEALFREKLSKKRAQIAASLWKSVKSKKAELEARAEDLKVQEQDRKRVEAQHLSNHAAHEALPPPEDPIPQITKEIIEAQLSRYAQQLLRSLEEDMGVNRDLEMLPSLVNETEKGEIDAEMGYITRKLEILELLVDSLLELRAVRQTYTSFERQGARLRNLPAALAMVEACQITHMQERRMATHEKGSFGEQMADIKRWFDALKRKQGGTKFFNDTTDLDHQVRLRGMAAIKGLRLFERPIPHNSFDIRDEHDHLVNLLHEYQTFASHVPGVGSGNVISTACADLRVQNLPKVLKCRLELLRASLIHVKEWEDQQDTANSGIVGLSSPDPREEEEKRKKVHDLFIKIGVSETLKGAVLGDTLKQLFEAKQAPQSG